jgi:hypothetical protein
MIDINEKKIPASGQHQRVGGVGVGLDALSARSLKNDNIRAAKSQQ